MPKNSTQPNQPDSPWWSKPRNVLVAIVACVMLIGLSSVASRLNREPAEVELPPLAVRQQAGSRTATIDEPALSRFTEHHKLPSIPPLDQMSARATEDFHHALKAIAEAPDTAESFGQLGRVFHSHQYLTEANVCYRRAEQLAPSDHQWPYYIGRIHADRYEHDEATVAYERAAQLNPGYAPTFLALGNLYLQSTNTDRAEQAFKRYVELQSDSAHGYLGLAQIAFDGQEPDKAIGLLKTALDYDPNDFRLHALLGRAYQQNGDNGLAMRHLAMIDRLNDKSKIAKSVSFHDPLYHQVLSANSTDAALKERQRAAMSANQPQVAIQLAQELCRRAPTDAMRQHRLATAYKKAKNYPQALAHAQRAIELDRKLLESHATKAQLLLILGKHEEALVATDWVVQNAPSFFNGHYYRGTALVLLRRYETAVESFRAAVELQPKSSRAHVALAEALGRAGQTEEAIESYRQALEFEPDNKRARQAIQALR